MKSRYPFIPMIALLLLSAPVGCGPAGDDGVQSEGAGNTEFPEDIFENFTFPGGGNEPSDGPVVDSAEGIDLRRLHEQLLSHIDFSDQRLVILEQDWNDLKADYRLSSLQ